MLFINNCTTAEEGHEMWLKTLETASFLFLVKMLFPKLKYTFKLSRLNFVYVLVFQLTLTLWKSASCFFSFVIRRSSVPPEGGIFPGITL